MSLKTLQILHLRLYHSADTPTDTPKRVLYPPPFLGGLTAVVIVMVTAFAIAGMHNRTYMVSK